MTTCKSCKAAIEWARTPSGRRIPVDLAPTADGNLVVINGTAYTYNYEDRALKVPRRTPHFATCPDARLWRQR